MAISQSSRRQPSKRRRAQPTLVNKSTRSKPSVKSVPALPISKRSWLGVLAVIAVSSWAYLPNFVEMVDIWRNFADYSHGFLVVPIALGIQWARRETMPDADRPMLVAGIILVVVATLIRLIAAKFFYTPVENWTFILVLIGTSLAIFGWQTTRWALPGILFLVFAMPLPYQLEIMMRQPLQRVATTLSSGALVVMGYPAIAETNTIRIGELVYGINEACSGLRIFWGIAAFAYAIAAVASGPRVVRLLLLLAVVPVALVANSSRIIGTCLGYMNFTSEEMKQTIHDGAGLVMIPYAVVLLLGVYALLLRLFPQRSVVASTLLPSSAVPSTTKR